MNNKRKFLIVGLFSVALLGGATTYVVCSQPNSENKVEEAKKVNTIKPKAKKDTWEKIIGEKEEQKDSTPKSEKNQSNNFSLKADDVLSAVSVEPKKGVFSKAKKDELIDQLALALNDQFTKEENRKEKALSDSNKPVLIDLNNKKQTNVPGSKKNDVVLEKLVDLDVDSEKLNGDQNKNTQNEELPTPGQDTKIDEPIISEINTDPTSEIDVPTNSNTIPGSTPDTPPTPSVDELVNNSKQELTNAAEEASKLNSELQKVKNELGNLQNIDSTSANFADNSTKQWQKVSDLVNEYNQISSKIKDYIDQDGTVGTVNYDLYKETYEQLNQKVNEMNVAQEKAKTTTNKMNEKVEKATDTLKNLDQTKNEYQNKQVDVAQAHSKVVSAVDHAQSTEQVSSATQNEVSEAKQVDQKLQDTNKNLGDQLNNVNKENSQKNIDTANKKIETVNNLAEEQNKNVNEANDDFSTLPKPTESTEVTPSVNTDQPDNTNASLQNVENSSDTKKQTTENKTIITNAANDNSTSSKTAIANDQK